MRALLYKKEFDKLKLKDSKVTFAEVRKKFVLGAAGALGVGLVKAVKTYLTGDPT